MTVIPIIIGALGTIPKELVKGLENFKVRGQVETIQITALLRSARILRRILVTWRDAKSSVKPSINAGMKKLSRQ